MPAEDLAPRRPLPVDRVCDEVRAAAAEGNVVIVAPPGSGKTTRVPPALEGQVVVVEPRRIAARLAATWVARERGEALGEEVGYQVRFDACCAPHTRVRYVTDGLLVRQMLDDPHLAGVDAVVIDEFHERRLHTDVALALLRHLQQTTRPDLRLIVMSATIDAAPIAAWLGGAAIVAAAGRVHPVEVTHEDRGDRRLEVAVASAVRRALDQADGDVLVFLPGAAEIRRAMEACEGMTATRGVELLPLHGDLPLDQQAAAVRAGARRRVVFATNVAESSVTVEGVTTVIDSGLVRRARTVPWSGLDEIRVEKISRASAEQRAGRAGRVRPGRCVRLYTLHDLQHRPEYEAAELHCVDLSEVLLLLLGAGVSRPAHLPWYEPPSDGALRHAETLLERLGALEEGRLTGVGQRMLTLPLSPRLARLVVEADRLGVPQDGRLAAALLSEGDVRREARARFDRDGVSARRLQSGPSDLLAMLDACRHGHDVDARALSRVRRLEQHLRRGGTARAGAADLDEGKREQALSRAVLSAWPDRVARRRRQSGAAVEVLMCGGGAARLAETSVVREAEWMVCVDAEERAGGVFVRVASEITADWLLDHFIDRIRETEQREWNPRTGRVEQVRRLSYDRLVIDETRSTAPRDAETTALLAAAAREAGLGAFTDPKGIEGLLHRLAFVATLSPEVETAGGREREGEIVLTALCEGCVSFDEVRALAERGGLMAALEHRLAPATRRLLERLAPTHVMLRGRRVPVHYEPDRAPWIASRMQDFFGMREGPRIGDGRVALVLHLLAPNMRPVQVTTDLSGFWTRTYPSVRRELGRRYPRHAWPDDPLAGGGQGSGRG